MNEDNLTPRTLSEATAIRLYNSVAGAEETVMATQKSIDSVHSAYDSGQSCRICRWNRSDMEVMRCPCHCKGTVGFIHMQCLKRWILHRRDHHCEICNGSFTMPEDKINIGRMFRNFCTQCAGPIVKHTLYGFSLIPLGHIVLQQVLVCMENINQSPHQQLTLSEIVVASCALLTSSALFFHIFEFITTRLLTIRYILRQWWSFGNTSDFPLIELDSEILEFF